MSGLRFEAEVVVQCVQLVVVVGQLRVSLMRLLARACRRSHRYRNSRQRQYGHRSLVVCMRS